MTLAVFFPSLMGVGILVSGALLLADLVRRFFPRRGVHRQRRVAMGAFGVVSTAAVWAGREVSAGELFDRAPRHRLTYGGWAAVCATSAVALPYVAAESYEDHLSPFYESPWMVGLGAAAAIVFGLLAVFLVAVVVLARRPSGPIPWLITRTSLGQLQVPESMPIDHSKGDPT
jgi:hypothetical protein